MPKSKSAAVLRRDFGRWLRQQREARGIRQKFVAEKSKITVTQLSRIENGQSGTRRDTVIHLAQIIGIDESEALRHFAPESFLQIPEELENIPFYEFDKQELQEIADFINFKLSLKRKEQADKPPEIEPKARDQATHKEEPEIQLKTLPEKDLGEVTSYRVKNGQLISEPKIKEKGHTKKKPPNKRH